MSSLLKDHGKAIIHIKQKVNFLVVFVIIAIF